MVAVDALIGELHHYMDRLNLAYMLAGIALYGLSLLVWSLRWALASRVSAKFSTIAHLLEGILVGVLVNNLISLYSVGGEVARVAWASYRSGLESARLLSGVAVERLSETPVAICYTLIFVKFVRSEVLHFTFSIGMIGRTRAFIKVTLENAREALRNPRLLAPLIALSLTLWMLDSIRLIVLAKAVGVDLSIPAALSLTILGIASRIIVLTPANIGVFEGISVGFLKTTGYSLGDAAALIVAERIVASIIPSILGLGIVLRNGGLIVLKNMARRVEGG